MSPQFGEDAFAVYVAMGSARSFRAIAERYGLALSEVESFALEQRWEERLADLELDGADPARLALLSGHRDMLERHRKLVRAMLTRAAKGLVDNPITSGIQSVRAAELAIQLDRMLATPAARSAADEPSGDPPGFDIWADEDDP